MNGQNDILGNREQVKRRLEQLLEISQDPQYDRYLNQMIQDLESGKAEPWQVEREAQRTYRIYLQRVSQGKEVGAPTEKAGQASQSVEFKVGIHVFSMIGAVFVLVAFVIFSFNFLNGLWQGVCLYAAAFVLTVLSEALLYRKMPAFSRAITGIGVGGLYIAGIVNYLVLHTMNGILAMLVTLVIAVATILYGRKRESTTIRMISLLGYYVCLLSIGSFENDLNFLVFVGMLFIINMVCVIFQNEKNRNAINIVHLTANIIFMAVITGMAWGEKIGTMYLVIFLVTSFIVMNFMAYVQCRDGKGKRLFPFLCIGNGLCLFLLFLVGNLGVGMEKAEVALFVHLLAEVLVAMVCTLGFLFWNRADARRWALVYYGVLVIVLLGSFSEYGAEVVASLLAALLLVKLFNRHKEVVVLECVVAAWVGMLALWHSDYWYCWILAGVLFVVSCKLHYMAVYHEIVATVSILAVWWSQCHFYFDDYGWEAKWFYPVSVGILFLLFLIYNHLPWLKEFGQFWYNVVNVAFMVCFYLFALLIRDMKISLVMMILGTISMIAMFGKGYKMYVPKRYFAVAIFLTCYALLGYFDTPVIVSIILMAVALTCVGIGFKLKDRAVRVYGLVMAVFVCLKLVFYDFIEVDTIYRVIVFLVVGILALVISFLYILLEKSEDKKIAQEDMDESLSGPAAKEEYERQKEPVYQEESESTDQEYEQQDESVDQNKDQMQERNCDDEESMD